MSWLADAFREDDDIGFLRKLIVVLLVLTVASPFLAIPLTHFVSGEALNAQYFFPLLVVMPVPLVILGVALWLSPSKARSGEVTPLHCIRWVLSFGLAAAATASPWYALGY